MSLEYEVDKNGLVTNVSGGMGLRASRPSSVGQGMGLRGFDMSIKKADRDFISKVMNNLSGDSHYNVENLSDLQREYGTVELQLGLLNGLLNYRDRVTEEIRQRQTKLDEMISVNEQLISRVKVLEIQIAQQNNCINNQQIIEQEMTNIIAKQMKDDELTKQIIKLYMNGCSQRKIAETLHISSYKVSEVVKKFKQG